MAQAGLPARGAAFRNSWLRLKEGAPAGVRASAVVDSTSSELVLPTGPSGGRCLETRHLYQAAVVYGTTKLENILFTRELGRRLEGTGVLATCFNPGLVATRLGRDDGGGFIDRSPPRRLMLTPEQGADTLVWLATAPADRLRQGALLQLPEGDAAPPAALQRPARAAVGGTLRATHREQVTMAQEDDERTAIS